MNTLLKQWKSQHPLWKPATQEPLGFFANESPVGAVCRFWGFGRLLGFPPWLRISVATPVAFKEYQWTLSLPSWNKKKEPMRVSWLAASTEPAQMKVSHTLNSSYINEFTWDIQVFLEGQVWGHFSTREETQQTTETRKRQTAPTGDSSAKKPKGSWVAGFYRGCWLFYCFSRVFIVHSLS